jgi:uncharacterized membrane protein required for colicin V production
MQFASVNTNLVDLLMVCIVARGVYIGKKNGFVTEFFKLLGIFFATIITLHYYVRFGNFLSKLLVPVAIQEILAYGILAVFITLLFSFIREGWLTILKVQIHDLVDYWGGLFISLIRVYLLCGLTILALIISGQQQLALNAKLSLSGQYLITSLPNIYKTSYTGFINKFFPQEPINNKVFHLKSKR